MIVNARPRTILPIPLLVALMAGCGSSASREAIPAKSAVETSKPKMQLSSSAFENNATIDERHTGDGEDLSPPLSWSEAPAGTASFALICDDPDAPSADDPANEPWVHWVIYNIPADMSKLPAGVTTELEPEEVLGARQGGNSWPSDNIGYRGPTPPSGSGEHRYFFKLYALDATLELDAGAAKDDLLDAMSGHVIAEGALIGIYER